MPKFYFTYGNDLNTQPYIGGWTVIEAPNLDIAMALHEAVHGRDANHLLRCAGIYAEPQFQRTKMYENGNFGERAQEIISYYRRTKTDV